jgi:hypothetical protein
MAMNFEYPPDLVAHIDRIDKFIHETILPLQHADDNNRFFDHRREYARTDWEAGGLPRREWEELLSASNNPKQTITPPSNHGLSIDT